MQTQTTTRGAGVCVNAHSRAVLTVMCVGMFLVLLDVTAVNVALPSIRAQMRTSLSGQQWVVDGYAVMIAGLLLGGGAMGDRLGHRRLVLVGLGVFAVASAACGFAPSIGALIVARAVQGAGAALLLPGTMAVITDAYPERAAQTRALGVWAAVSSLGLPVGPMMSGVLVSTMGWRPIFLINVPVVAVALMATMRLVPARPHSSRSDLDLAGLMTAPLVPASAVFAVTSVERGFGTQTCCALGVLVLSTALFAWVERRAVRPVLPLHLFRRRDFLGANLAALLMNLCFNGTLFVITLDLQSAHGESAMRAGMSLVPVAVPMVLLPPVAGRLVARFGPGLPMTLGIGVAMGSALWMVRMEPYSGFVELLPLLLLLGVGAGLLTTAVVAAAVRSLPADMSGLASGVNNMCRQTGTAAGVALFGAVTGSPVHGRRAQFFTGWHHLAWVAIGLWAIALAATTFGVRASAHRR
jgi:MFS transporter, DHA2 family, methylenomycin A resistance protein